MGPKVVPTAVVPTKYVSRGHGPLGRVFAPIARDLSHLDRGFGFVVRCIGTKNIVATSNVLCLLGLVRSVLGAEFQGELNEYGATRRGASANKEDSHMGSGGSQAAVSAAEVEKKKTKADKGSKKKNKVKGAIEDESVGKKATVRKTRAASASPMTGKSDTSSGKKERRRRKTRSSSRCSRATRSKKRRGRSPSRRPTPSGTSGAFGYQMAWPTMSGGQFGQPYQQIMGAFPSGLASSMLGMPPPSTYGGGGFVGGTGPTWTGPGLSPLGAAAQAQMPGASGPGAVTGSAWSLGPSPASGAVRTAEVRGLDAKEPGLAALEKQLEETKTELEELKGIHQTCLNLFEDLAKDLGTPGLAPGQIRASLGKWLKQHRANGAALAQARAVQTNLEVNKQMAIATFATPEFRDWMVHLGLLAIDPKTKALAWRPGKIVGPSAGTDKDTSKDQELAAKLMVATGGKAGTGVTGGSVASSAERPAAAHAAKGSTEPMAPAEEPLDVDDGGNVAAAANSAGGKKKAWHEDLQELPVDREADMIKMARSQVTLGEAMKLGDLKGKLQEWASKSRFTEEKTLKLLRGKLTSTMVFGTPHSVGVMCRFFAPAGRIAATVSHYAGLEDVTALDIIGCSTWTQEAEALAVEMSDITGQRADEDQFVVCIKINGAHAFAEDGGKISTGKSGGGTKGGKWNQWVRQN